MKWKSEVATFMLVEQNEAHTFRFQTELQI